LLKLTLHYEPSCTNQTKGALLFRYQKGVLYNDTPANALDELINTDKKDICEFQPWKWCRFNVPLKKKMVNNTEQEQLNIDETSEGIIQLFDMSGVLPQNEFLGIVWATMTIEFVGFQPDVSTAFTRCGPCNFNCTGTIAAGSGYQILLTLTGLTTSLVLETNSIYELAISECSTGGGGSKILHSGGRMYLITDASLATVKYAYPSWNEAIMAMDAGDATADNALQSVKNRTGVTSTLVACGTATWIGSVADMGKLAVQMRDADLDPNYVPPFIPLPTPNSPRIEEKVDESGSTSDWQLPSETTDPPSMSSDLGVDFNETIVASLHEKLETMDSEQQKTFFSAMMSFFGGGRGPHGNVSALK